MLPFMFLFCLSDFKVSVVSNKSKPEEGDDITLTCSHNLPNVTLKFEWKKNEKEIPGKNMSELILENLEAGPDNFYTCSVGSPCGTYDFTYTVSVDGGK